MDAYDAVIVGGGPAGSSCAWRLSAAGLNVLVMDASAFPRDKVCAGWITPQVVTALEFDVEAYRHGRTFQPITGFDVGVIGDHNGVQVSYPHPVSYGIRRCEFDDYLLRRSGATLRLGTPIVDMRRRDEAWIINDTIRTPMLIGAGGQFCPVAKWMNGPTNAAPLVVAQEVEFEVRAEDASSVAIDQSRPELYFCDDLKGYGWCFRKGEYLNIGLGRQDRQSLPAATAHFVEFLKAKRKISPATAWKWRGHAYGLYEGAKRRMIDGGTLLVGDAAGLAYAQSGEGIRPAVESGLIAAMTIIEADGRYSRSRLEAYRERLDARFGTSAIAKSISRILPARISLSVARRLLTMPVFVRHVVIDRWFLHANEPALTFDMHRMRALAHA